jgi:hypothetical protein
MDQEVNETIPQPGARVNNVFFQAPVEICLAVKHLAVNRKATIKAIWIQAMLEFLARNHD